MRHPSIPAVRLNHAVLFVADLERSIDFYTSVFGMEVAAREPRARAAFLRLTHGDNHHDLGLFGIGADRSSGRGIGLYHLAWQVDTIEQLERGARLTLADADAFTGESSHGATKSVYGKDPDGNEFEVMWMLPRAEWGRYEHEAPVERLDLAAEVGSWSGVRTAGRVVVDEDAAMTRLRRTRPRLGRRVRRPGPPARRAAARSRLARAGHHRPRRTPARGAVVRRRARADRRGRWLRVVRQPRDRPAGGREPGRDDGVVPRVARRRRPGRAPRRAGRLQRGCCLRRRARARATRAATPVLRSSTARCPSRTRASPWRPGG